MGSFLKNIFSMKMAVIFLLLFAIASGVATFIENDFGTAGSWSVVYTATWFEFIQIMLGLMIVYNMFKYNVFQKKKLPSLMFHLGFVVILIGSGITRYMGYEGSLHIREGKTENRVVSGESFIIVHAKKGNKVYSVAKKKIISSIGSNDFSMSLDVDGEKASIEYKKFVPNATTDVVDDPDGKPMISMMVSSGGRTENVVLKNRDFLSKTYIQFSLNSDSKSRSKFNVNITIRDGKFYFISDQDISWFKMTENTRGVYKANEEHPFEGKQLFTLGETNFAPRERQILHLNI